MLVNISLSNWKIKMVLCQIPIKVLQCLAEKLVFCWLWKIWYSYVCNQNWKMIDTSLERPDSQLWSVVSKISKLSRLLSFRLNLIWAKITQFSKLNNFVTDEYFFFETLFSKSSHKCYEMLPVFFDLHQNCEFYTTFVEKIPFFKFNLKLF